MIKITTQRGSDTWHAARHALLQPLQPDFHIHSHSCRVNTQQTEWEQTWIQPERDGGEKRQRPGSRTFGRYFKGSDYLGGCSGGQLLHCRESESDDVVSWCRWVWMIGLPPLLRGLRWWRADASGMGSPARQPLNREKRKVLFSFPGVLSTKSTLE